LHVVGGLQAVGELLQLDYDANGNTDHVYHVTMRRYACMMLTNLTYGDAANKSLLCSSTTVLQAVIAQLDSPSEDLCQVASSVIRNLSWHADLAGKRSLREAGAVGSVVRAAIYSGRSELTLKSLLSALWNLSSHGPENKADVCAVPGALEFLVTMLNYRGPSRTLAIPENAGGVLRNISSHVAGRDDYRALLRRAGCLPILLRQLRSPSLTVVSNACGTLWNLSARCAEDQAMLLELGAVTMLKNLVNSRHRMISMGSAAALKNLLSAASTLGFGVSGASSSVSGRMPISLLFESPMMTRSDSAASSPAPGLHVRRQRAFEEELNRRELSETCDNMESPTTSPTGTLENRGLKSVRSSSSVAVPPTRRIQSPSPMRVAMNTSGRLEAVLQSSICRSASSGGIVGSADNYAGEHRVRGILHRSSRLLVDRQQREAILQTSSLLLSRCQTAADDRRVESPRCLNSPSPVSPPSSSSPSSSIFDRQPRSVSNFLKKQSAEPTPEPSKHSLDFVPSSFMSLRSENVQLGDLDDLEVVSYTESIKLGNLDDHEVISCVDNELVNVELNESKDCETLSSVLVNSSRTESSIIDNCAAVDSDSHPCINETTEESCRPSVDCLPAEEFLPASSATEDQTLYASLKEDDSAERCDLEKSMNNEELVCIGDLNTNKDQRSGKVVCGERNSGSGVLLDMSDLFQSKMRSPKRKPPWLLKHREGKSSQALMPESCSSSINQPSAVDSLIGEHQENAIVSDIASSVVVSEKQCSTSQTSSIEIGFSPLFYRKTGLTSSQLSATDIMKESLPSMTSSLMCDMTESVEGLLRRDSSSELANPSSLTTIHAGDEQLEQTRFQCDAIGMRLNEFTESVLEVTGHLLNEQEQSFSSSTELEKILEENANRVLLELDASSLAEASKTMEKVTCAIGSPSSDIQLLEDETLSLVSIDDDSDVLIQDDSDDDCNDAVSNRTYDVGASDFKEDISSSGSENHGKDGQYRYRRRRRRSRNEWVVSSSDDRSSDSSEERIPACAAGVVRPVGGPRIVKPGTVAVKQQSTTLAGCDQNEPKGIRGKRKTLYSKTKPAVVASATAQTGTGPLSGAKVPSVRGRAGVRAPETSCAKKESSLTVTNGRTPPKSSSVPGRSSVAVPKQAPVAGQTMTGPGIWQQPKKLLVPSVRGQGKSIAGTMSMSVTESDSTLASSRAAVQLVATKDTSKQSKDAAKPCPPGVDRSKLSVPQTNKTATRNSSPSFRPKGSRMLSPSVTRRSANEPDANIAGKSDTSTIEREKQAVGVKHEITTGVLSNGVNGSLTVNSVKSMASSAVASAGSKQNKPEVKPRSSSSLSSTGVTLVQSKSGRTSAGSDSVPKSDAMAKTAVLNKSIVKPTTTTATRPSSATRTRSLGPAPATPSTGQRSSARTSSPSMLDVGRRSPAVTRRAAPTTSGVGGATSRSRTSSLDSACSISAKLSSTYTAPAAATRTVGAVVSQRSSSLGGFGYGRNHAPPVKASVEGKDNKSSKKLTEELAVGASQTTTKPVRVPTSKMSDTSTAASSSASKHSLRNTFVLTRSSTYDKLTDVTATPTAAETVNATSIDAARQPDNDVSQPERDQHRPSVAKTSTFTKRQPRWRQTTAAEAGEHEDDGKSRPEDVNAVGSAGGSKSTSDVVLRRVRAEPSTTSTQQEVRRRSSRLSGHQFDNPGAQQLAHRRSGNGSLSTVAVRSSSGVVSPRNSVNMTSSQSTVASKAIEKDVVTTGDQSTIANDVNSGDGRSTFDKAAEVRTVAAEQHLKQCDDEMKRSSRASDGPSTTRKFGFIGGLLKRNRAATMPRRPTYEDIHCSDDLQSVFSGNKNGCSKTLPVGTLPPKYFDMKKSTSTSEQHDAAVSTKRKTFSWWRRTPVLINAGAPKSVSNKNESNNAVADTRRSRIPAAFVFGGGSTTKKKSNAQQLQPQIEAGSAPSVGSKVPPCRPPSPVSWASTVSSLNNRTPTTVGPASETSGIGGLSITKTAMLIERRRIQRAKIAAAAAAAASDTSRDDDCGETVHNKLTCSSSKSTADDDHSLMASESNSSSVLVKGKHNFLMTTV